jgi:hypothetical protein
VPAGTGYKGSPKKEMIDALRGNDVVGEDEV